MSCWGRRMRWRSSCSTGRTVFMQTGRERGYAMLERALT